MKHKEEKQPELFTIPQETSWHFERILKPEDKTIDNYVLIQPGAPDIVKVLKAYFHHPVPGYNIASIEIVYNEQLNRLFFAQMTTMNKRKGNPKYTPTWKTDTQGTEKQHREATYQQLQTLSEGHRDVSVPNMTILPLWHGTSEEVSGHIFNTGYGIFNSNNPQFVTDEGFFGRGVYTAHEAEYSFRCYAQKHGDKAVLLLNWVSLFEAYPIIHGDMPKVQGKSMGYDFCDAHFIPVRSNQHPNTSLYYPCDQGEKHQYSELVVFNPAQSLPRYRVKLLKNTPKPSLDEVGLTSYQMGLDLFGLYQYDQVSNAFEGAQDAGHPAASIRLHWLHSGASGVIPANTTELAKYQTVSKETIAWLKSKASFKGENDQEAQFLLGWCHQQGLGTEVNLAKAAKYYWIAATQGHRDAQYQFGVCCSAGMGVQQNMKAAIEYYEKAAAQNHIHAHYVLSQCYTLGLGVLPAATKATLHRQAAQKGRHPLAAAPSGANPTLPLPTVPPLTPSLQAAFDQEVNQLKQALSGEKQASQNKDKTLAEKDKTHQQQQQVLLNQQQALWSKEQELNVQTQQLEAQKKETQFEKQKVTELSAKLDRVSNDLTQKLGELNAENQEKELKNQQLRSEIIKLKQDLQVADDEKIALRMQLIEAERATQPATPPSARGRFPGGIFFTEPPTSPFPVKSSQKSLTYAQQVEATSKAAQDKINQKELSELLKWVTEGHLVKVEKLLKKNPNLGLGTGTVTDRSDRTFKNITVLQYAAWALDAEMVALIIEYIGAHHSAVQMKALAEAPQTYSVHGASYDMTPLVNKYQPYMDQGTSGNLWDNDKCCQHWQKEIGGEQRKCPAWLIYAWCEEGTDVAWTKQDPNRKIKREYDKHRLEWWFTENYNGGLGVGSTWAVWRPGYGRLAASIWTVQAYLMSPIEFWQIVQERGGGWEIWRGACVEKQRVSLFVTARREMIQGLLKNQVENSLSAEINALLKWAAEGHLEEVEKLLRNNPMLALGKGTVTDRSDRTFKNITVLQYAAWALDGEMIDLIIQYAGAYHAAVQMKALAESPQIYSQYGASYDVGSLVNKYQTYIDNYSKWDGNKRCDYWQKEIGGEQRKCPAWLIYAWSEAGNDVAWTKQNPNRKIKREYDKHRLDRWFTENYNNGRGVGTAWAAARGSDEGGVLITSGPFFRDMTPWWAIDDSKRVLNFGTTRRETLQRLKNQVEVEAQSTAKTSAPTPY